MAEKKVSYVQVVLVVIVIIGLLVGVGPWLVGTYFEKFVKIRPVHNAAVYAKISGTISEEKSGQRSVVVITTADSKKYAIVGSKADAVKKLAGKHLEVFGAIMPASPAAIAVGGKPVPIVFNVDVSKMDSQELVVGTTLTKEQLAARQSMIDDQLAFRTATLAKLNKKGWDVVKGKLYFEKYIDSRSHKNGELLVLIDKYNVKHNLIGDPLESPLLPFIKDFKTYENADIVLLGHDYDDPIPGVPFEPGVRTFKVRLAYFDNLTEIKPVEKAPKN